jgi:hypothetical protein
VLRAGAKAMSKGELPQSELREACAEDIDRKVRERYDAAQQGEYRVNFCEDGDRCSGELELAVPC